jgi:hypothetical protein
MKMKGVNGPPPPMASSKSMPLTSSVSATPEEYKRLQVGDHIVGVNSINFGTMNSFNVDGGILSAEALKLTPGGAAQGASSSSSSSSSSPPARVDGSLVFGTLLSQATRASSRSPVAQQQRSVLLRVRRLSPEGLMVQEAYKKVAGVTVSHCIPRPFWLTPEVEVRLRSALVTLLRAEKQALIPRFAFRSRPFMERLAVRVADITLSWKAPTQSPRITGNSTNSFGDSQGGGGGALKSG